MSRFYFHIDDDRTHIKHLDDLEHWRMCAKEMRALADQIGYRPHKKEILGIAADCERLAARVEEAAKGQR